MEIQKEFSKGYSALSKNSRKYGKDPHIFMKLGHFAPILILLSLIVTKV